MLSNVVSYYFLIHIHVTCETVEDPSGCILSYNNEMNSQNKAVLWHNAAKIATLTEEILLKKATCGNEWQK
jgi:hypothetical protein